ncbi:hypothetical protein GAGA_0714 [Paraglaciecola agarilytica NO2]|uniref:Polysaccharide pyruvyl transferase domain-containing protein n=2 Tax=Paraglaciecola chathamensis TaxID=368405 RepID=A0ABQ0I2P4_9ALTE|nr:hypothetical protein GAGA_0714 [Paraglaciecola agarilytica NO2]
MPVIFNMFIEKYYPNILHDYSIKYVSIGNSDLSQYDCPQTEKMNDITSSAPAGSLLVVVGGEVLCASNLTLLMHVQKTPIAYKVLDSARFLFRRYLSVVTKRFYGTRWEFPYIPPKREFSNNIKIAYSTVGGGISTLPPRVKELVAARLRSADYFSVRDNRTLSDVSKEVGNVKLYPDSVLLIPALLTEEELTDKVSERVKAACEDNYLCFQASPHKVGLNVEVVAETIIKISEAKRQKVILLPIGYASSHDDLIFLRKLHNLFPQNTLLLSELTVWEIMFTIMRANCFIGTSLHGVVTAMAFAVPHFVINPKIDKVSSFVKDWSVDPFNNSYSLDELIEITSSDLSWSKKSMQSNSLFLANLVKENNSNICNLL